MIPAELSELREKQESAEREAEIEADAVRIAPRVAEILEQSGSRRPSPSEVLEAARSSAGLHRERIEEKAESAIRDATSVSFKSTPIVSASQFVGIRITREPAIAKIANAFGAEIEASSKDLRRMAVALLDRIEHLTGPTRSGSPPEEDAIQIIEEMEGELGDLDPDAYVQLVRAEMGLPPEADASSN